MVKPRLSPADDDMIFTLKYLFYTNFVLSYYIDIASTLSYMMLY